MARDSIHGKRWLKWITAAAAIYLPALALADEPRTPEPKQLQQLQDDLRTRLSALGDVKREKGSYLGISVAAPPAVLRKQLGLAPGLGLVVEFVVPGSPAAKAGVQQFDVLQKLDDQIIINGQQFTVLVRMHKPGDEIKLSFIRDGKPMTVAAALVEHDVEPLALEGEEGMHLQRAFPEARSWPIPPGQLPPSVRLWDEAVGPMKGGLWSITWLEGDRSYAVIATPQGHRTFTVKGKDGKVIFEGPIDTKEDREKVPAELRAKLNKLQPEIP